MPTADLSSYHQNNATTSDGAKFNNLIDAIQALLNNLDTNNLSATAGITAGQLAAGVAAVPTGVTLEYCAAAAPTGFLLCDGTAVSRATYATLFGVIGTTYGVGDGSTTFNLPDFRGRVAVGYAAAGGHTDVATLGNNDGQAAANRRPKHRTTNGLTLPNHVHGTNMTTGVGAGDLQKFTGIDTSGATTLAATNNPTTNPAIGGSVGTGVANDALDTPSYIVVNRIIKT